MTLQVEREYAPNIDKMVEALRLILTSDACGQSAVEDRAFNEESMAHSAGLVEGDGADDQAERASSNTVDS